MLKSVVASSLPIRKDYPFIVGQSGVGSIIERKSYTVMRKGRESFSVVLPTFYTLYPRFSSHISMLRHFQQIHLGYPFLVPFTFVGHLSSGLVGFQPL